MAKILMSTTFPLSQAQYIAGMGFSNVGLGIVHSMAHPLGAFYDTPHGVANALLLPTACFTPTIRDHIIT